MSEELSALTQGLGLFDAEAGLVRMLASLVAASHEFIGIADLEGNALFVNEAGRKLVGLRDLDAVRSTRIIDYFAGPDHHKLVQEVLPAVRDTGFWEGELTFQILKRDSSYLYCTTSFQFVVRREQSQPTEL